MSVRQAPVTWSFIAAMAVGFLLTFFGAASFVQLLAFQADAALARPWSFLTYPFAILQPGSAFFFLLLSGLWLYQMGSAVERDLGAQRYLGVFFGFALLGSLAVWLFSGLAPRAGALYGGLLPVGALTMIWAARNSHAQVMFFGLVPVTAKVLAAITAGIVFFGIGSMHPIYGLAALLPLALAWFWALDRLPLRYPVGGSTYNPARVDRKLIAREEARDREYRNRVREKEKEREERERLRRLFESSLSDRPEDR